MEALEVKKKAEADGIQFILADGKLRARGSHEIVNKWLPVIKKHKADLVTALSMTIRTWTPGNPFTCISCGRATGWTTDGQPLCPGCVPPDDPEKYRRDMLAWADELEQAARDATDDRREAMMMVAAAVRAEFAD